VIIQDYNTQLCTKKSEVMVFYVKEPVRSEIAMNDRPIEHMQSLAFLGCKLTHYKEDYIDWL
jgi:hypothetical protein